MKNWKNTPLIIAKKEIFFVMYTAGVFSANGEAFYAANIYVYCD
jgi:hypothetical protein